RHVSIKARSTSPDARSTQPSSRACCADTPYENQALLKWCMGCQHPRRARLHPATKFSRMKRWSDGHRHQKSSRAYWPNNVLLSSDDEPEPPLLHRINQLIQLAPIHHFNEGFPARLVADHVDRRRVIQADARTQVFIGINERCQLSIWIHHERQIDALLAGKFLGEAAQIVR